MDLWVRTQDKKRIMNCLDIGIAMHACKNAKPNICETGHDILGTYDTEERCIEILNEIQAKMMASVAGQGCLVYQMPES